MLKRATPSEVDYQQPPRKLIKISHAEDAHYDEFKGECEESPEPQPMPSEEGKDAPVSFRNYQ